jgi:DNA-binding HxlR family transcriptional regulator
MCDHGRVRDYGQFCPVARALDVCGDRWSLLLVREMTSGPRRFSDLATALPRLSRALLARRLRQLGRAGIVTRSPTGYRLTAAGTDLTPVLNALGRWGLAHTPADPSRGELDPDLLAWWLRDRFDRTALPNGRTVIHLRLSAPSRQYWLLLHPEAVDLCRTDPGLPIDLVLSADTAELLRVAQGWRPLDRALRGGLITLTGPTALTRAFPTWFTSPQPQLSGVAAADIAGAFDSADDGGENARHGP